MLAFALCFSHHIFCCFGEVKMAVTLSGLERRARYLMGAIAIVAAAGMAAFKLGWISTAPSYKENSWYLVGGSRNVVITSEYVDEAACREKESTSSVCRSGKALMKEAREYQNRRS